MRIKELKKIFKADPLPVHLLSHEGDIYLCQVDGKNILRNSDETPVVFHSIGEAKEVLGQRIAAHLTLVYSKTYDEMIRLENSEGS